MFRGEECKEPLAGLAATPANVRYASNLRGEILNAIARRDFNYASYFPESERAQLLGSAPAGELVGKALDDFMAIARLAASTRLTYGRVIERYLRPWFGKVRVQDLTTPVIRAKILAVRRDDDEDTPVTLKTARNILAPLGSTLELAVGDGRLADNPMDRLKLERFWPEDFVKSDFEADPFAWAEMEALFAACLDGPAGEEADYFRNAFGTGMRPSEQIELRWPCVDLVQHRFSVEVARVTSKADPAVSSLKLGSTVKRPKTRASRRFIDFTLGAWEGLQRQQARTRLSGGHVWRDARYGAPWRSEEAVRKRFETLCKRAGVRYRNSYQTRHTFASALLAAGFDPRWVITQMGHTTTAMLESRYGKWIDQGSDPAARELLAAFFSHVSPTVAASATFWARRP